MVVYLKRDISLKIWLEYGLIDSGFCKQSSLNTTKHSVFVMATVALQSPPKFKPRDTNTTKGSNDVIQNNSS